MTAHKQSAVPRRIAQHRPGRGEASSARRRPTPCPRLAGL